MALGAQRHRDLVILRVVADQARGDADDDARIFSPEYFRANYLDLAISLI